MRIVFAWFVLIALLFTASPLGAAETDFQGDELFALLEQESELATKSKKNIDYLPGLITVLQQNELKHFGFQTVMEALEMVPGIDFSQKGLIVRGIGNAYISGKTKIMINGVALNDTTTSSARSILQLPVEMVQRIEVIRGPGSALYGEYAYSGMINIVTVKETNTVFAGYEDFGHDHTGTRGGIAAFYKDPELSMQMIATDTRSDGPYTDVKSDVIYEKFASNIPVSNAPGSAELLHRENFYLFDLRYKDFSLSVYSVDASEGEGFGETDALPVDDGKQNIQSIRKTYEARQRIVLDEATELKVKAGYLETQLRLKEIYIFPEGFTYIYPFTDGVIAGSYTKEDKRYGSVELGIEAFADHKLLVGVEKSHSRITESYIERNIDYATYQPLGSLQRFSGDYGLVSGNPERILFSLYAQDEWSATEQTTVTLGVRYDDYDDIGTNTSPRIAAVYELSPVHLFKVQYAQAFRPPNYLELYMQNNPFVRGDETLKAETVDTAEAAYIFNNQERVIRIGLFRSVLQNLIGLTKQNDFFGTYTDKGVAVVEGAEAEFEKHYFDDTTIRGHLSYVNARNDIDTIDRYAALIGSAGISKKVSPSFGAALLYRYTGTRERQKEDSRDAMAEEHRFDLTLFYTPAVLNGLTIKAGIKNILDAQAASPAPADTYEEDYQGAGRNYWLKAEYRF